MHSPIKKSLFSFIYASPHQLIYVIYKEKQSVSQINVFKHSFGDEFDYNGTIWIHHGLFHVLETKFQFKDVSMIF